MRSGFVRVSSASFLTVNAGLPTGQFTVHSLGAILPQGRAMAGIGTVVGGGKRPFLLVPVPPSAANSTTSDDFAAWYAQTTGAGHPWDANGDDDADGISNGAELAQGTNVFSADTDGDGLSDLQEQRFDTDPTRPNTENETAEGDADGDGVTNSEELRAGSLPQSQHSDSDGVPDGLDAFPTSHILGTPRQPVSRYAAIPLGTGLPEVIRAGINNNGAVLLETWNWADGTMFHVWTGEGGLRQIPKPLVSNCNSSQLCMFSGCQPICSSPRRNLPFSIH